MPEQHCCGAYKLQYRNLKGPPTPPLPCSALFNPLELTFPNIPAAQRALASFADMAHDAKNDTWNPHVIAAADGVMQAAVSVVIMQQFRFATGGRADCKRTAVKLCKLA